MISKSISKDNAHEEVCESEPKTSCEAEMRVSSEVTPVSHVDIQNQGDQTNHEKKEKMFRNTLQAFFHSHNPFNDTNSPFLDSSVQVSTRAELHHFTPMLVLILDEIDGLDDIGMVQRR